MVSLTDDEIKAGIRPHTKRTIRTNPKYEPRLAMAVTHPGAAGDKSRRDHVYSSCIIITDPAASRKHEQEPVRPNQLTHISVTNHQNSTKRCNFQGTTVQHNDGFYSLLLDRDQTPDLDTGIPLGKKPFKSGFTHGPRTLLWTSLLFEGRIEITYRQELEIFQVPGDGCIGM